MDGRWTEKNIGANGGFPGLGNIVTRADEGFLLLRKSNRIEWIESRLTWLKTTAEAGGAGSRPIDLAVHLVRTFLSQPNRHNS